MAYGFIHISCPVFLLCVASGRCMYTCDDASVDASDDVSMLQSRVEPMQSDRDDNREDNTVEVLSTETDLEQELIDIHQNQAQLKKQLELLEQQERAVKHDLEDHGTKDCPCVGIDGLKGALNVTLKNFSFAPFPADLGAVCSTWNDTNVIWAGPKKWCYVDPCNCNISPLPEPSLFLPGAEYQGHALYFSYATCGSTTLSTSSTKDTNYSKSIATKANQTINDICAAPVDPATWGNEDCQCVGIAGTSGYLNISIMDVSTQFPADYGSKCSAWDQGTHPDCKTNVQEMATWCKESWCYVDPCSCNLTTPPRASQMRGADVSGKHVFWSYTTCGSQDIYSTWEGTVACVDRNTSNNCSSATKCAWTGTECLAKELVDICYGSKPSSEGPPSLILPIVGAALGIAIVIALLCYCCR